MESDTETLPTNILLSACALAECTGSILPPNKLPRQSMGETFAYQATPSEQLTTPGNVITFWHLFGSNEKSTHSHLIDGLRTDVFDRQLCHRGRDETELFAVPLADLRSLAASFVYGATFSSLQHEGEVALRDTIQKLISRDLPAVNKDFIIICDCAGDILFCKQRGSRQETSCKSHPIYRVTYMLRLLYPRLVGHYKQISRYKPMKLKRYEQKTGA